MSEAAKIKWCVAYRTGGPFKLADVKALQHNIRLFHPEIPLVVFSDDPKAALFCDERIPLEAAWSQGHWSVTECFRLTGPVFFTGLDTILMARIDDMLEMVLRLGPEDFMMMRPINPKRRKMGQFASGVMGWNGDFSWIYHSFPPDRARGREQEYTQSVLRKAGRHIVAVDDACDGIYSYKRHYRTGKAPVERIRLLVFHGDPRPSQIQEPALKKLRGES